ncbi:SRPBCC domain-containing protein [Pseudoduganella lutea]|uniref:Polyketide cyclase n=1 Tax=Pseudoduganella lutea TaxID=321985 RepID=A0A4P6KSX9_9BURK|nr:SRPBCC domain-containing protein [Pseudoduganella lutea]QBE61817.1 polyketide cyclase [Pseudoduganella lutea]
MVQAAQFDTFTLERTFAAPLARVFRAFSEPREKKRWFTEGAQHEIEQYDMAFEVGGRELARYRFKPGMPFAGVALESDGYFLDIVPQQRIVAAATMAMDGRRFSASLHTFEFFSEGADSTRLVFTHQAMYGDGADGPELRRAGWQQLLGQLHAALAIK